MRARRLSVLGLALAFFVALTAVVAPAEAASGTVRGAIIGKHGTPKVKVLYFTLDWTYLGVVKAPGGGYSLSLAPGTYRLQLVDQAPAYDVGKYAPTDVTVTVTEGTTTVRNVRMRTGAAVGGKVRAGGKIASGARVVAANTSEQSFETTTDKSGSFALGGLPPGKYSVFTYDRTKKWVQKSTYLGKVKKGAFRSVTINLKKKAGTLLVDLYAGSERATAPVFVTAVSSSSGQFWTVQAKGGSATFRGLFPGRYTLVAPGYGDYLAQTGPVTQGKVKAGRAAFGSFRWTVSGARLTGRVVDARDGTTALGEAQVLLFNAAGAQIGATTSGADGRFVLSGGLSTQSGLTVLAQPGANAPFLGTGATNNYCKYAAGSVGSLAITAGATVDVGNLALPRLPDAQQDPNAASCRTAA